MYQPSNCDSSNSFSPYGEEDMIRGQHRTYPMMKDSPMNVPYNMQGPSPPYGQTPHLRSPSTSGSWEYNQMSTSQDLSAGTSGYGAVRDTASVPPKWPGMASANYYDRNNYFPRTASRDFATMNPNPEANTTSSPNYNQYLMNNVVAHGSTWSYHQPAPQATPRNPEFFGFNSTAPTRYGNTFSPPQQTSVQPMNDSGYQMNVAPRQDRRRGRRQASSSSADSVDIKPFEGQEAWNPNNMGYLPEQLSARLQPTSPAAATSAVRTPRGRKCRRKINPAVKQALLKRGSRSYRPPPSPAKEEAESPVPSASEQEDDSNDLADISDSTVTSSTESDSIPIITAKKRKICAYWELSPTFGVDGDVKEENTPNMKEIYRLLIADLPDSEFTDDLPRSALEKFAENIEDINIEDVHAFSKEHSVAAKKNKDKNDNVAVSRNTRKYTDWWSNLMNDLPDEILEDTVGLMQECAVRRAAKNNSRR